MRSKLELIDDFVSLCRRNTLPLHVRECVDCYVRPWKVVEFCQRHFSSSCAIRPDKSSVTSNMYQQEFEIDREYYSFDESITYKVS